MKENDSFEKLIADMEDPKSTCTRCEFKVCPMLGMFSARIRDLANAIKNRPDRQIEYATALRKIEESASSRFNDTSTLGYIYRVAHNALNQIS